MRQKHVWTALVIFAVTGAVSVPNSFAGAWRLDVSNRHVVDPGGLGWGPVVYTQLATGVPPDVQLTYDYIWQGQRPKSGYGDSQSDRSGYGMENKSGSLSNDSRYGPTPSDNYFRKESSGAPTSPYSETIYGGVPTTPSADPLVRELSR